MPNLTLLAERLLNRAHYVTPSYAQTVASILANRMGLQPMLGADQLEMVPRTSRDLMMHRGILVLPVVGGLYHRGDTIDAMSGAQSYTNLSNLLHEAMKDGEVRGVLLDIDSPGGQAAGCFEFADMLADARKIKPVRALANCSAFSAAYAIAAATEHIYVTPSGEVGSIGVVRLHTDVSAAMKDAGVKVTLIHAGAHKVDGNPYEPLPANVRAGIQAEIDEKYDMFVSFVAEHRPMTEKQVRKTEAACFPAARAIELGLADEEASFEKALTAFADELNRPTTVRVNSKGKFMAQTQPQATRIEGLDEALSRARDDGAAAATAAAQPKILDAYMQGRSDAAAIMQSEAANGRTAAAAAFAGNAKFGKDEAITFLSAMPKVEDAQASAADFKAKLASADPKVPAGDPTPAAASTTNPVSDFQNSVGAHVRAMLGHKA